MSIVKDMASFILSGASYASDTLKSLRLRVNSLSQAELATVEGRRFYTEFDKVFANGETVYLLFQNPPESSGFFVSLQERRFKSLNGPVDLEILWDSTGVVPGATIQAFNENENSIKTSNMVVSVIAPPTTDGLIREKDFLTGSGAGSNSSGDVSPESGTRIYSPDSFFIAKIINQHNSTNRIHLSYSHAELPISEFLQG